MENSDLIARIAALDPDLASEVRRELAYTSSVARVRASHDNLGETISRYSYDATGQDGEAEIDAAARDYCDAQDDHIKRTDPIRWSEMQMGA